MSDFIISPRRKFTGGVSKTQKLKREEKKTISANRSLRPGVSHTLQPVRRAATGINSRGGHRAGLNAASDSQPTLCGGGFSRCTGHGFFSPTDDKILVIPRCRSPSFVSALAESGGCSRGDRFQLPSFYGDTGSRGLQLFEKPSQTDQKYPSFSGALTEYDDPGLAGLLVLEVKLSSLTIVTTLSIWIFMPMSGRPFQGLVQTDD